jgi:hypothetical protein
MTDPVKYPLADNDQIFFLHIPKTGGMTLKTLLKQNVGSNQFHQIPIRKFDSVHARDLLGYRCIRAHWDYNFFRVLSRKPVYITMLRHPVARMISMYGMIRRKPQSRWFTPDIHHFIDRMSAERLQVHFLAGAIFGRPVTGAALLEVALTRLQECAFFGIVERFTQSVDLLCATFGWPRVTAVDVRNEAADKTPPPDAAVIAHIEEASSLDMAFYQSALRLFEDRRAPACARGEL